MIATSSGFGRYKNIVTAIDRLEQRPNKRLLLKPNLVGGGLAATHVDAVRAVLDSMDVDLIAEGSSVDTFGLYSMLGYRKLAHEYGVDLVDINRTDEWGEIEFTTIDARKVKVRVSEFSRKWNVVSLALPKTHDHAIVTLTLKNMLGFVHPEDRGLVHGYIATFGKLMRIAPLRKVAARLSRFRSLRRFYSSTEVEERAYLLGAKVVHKNIVALLKFAMPKLGIIDGFVGMQGEGPIGGEPVEWDMAIAGDPVECDVFCAHKMGFDPTDVGYLYHLGVPMISEIKAVGDEIPQKKFKPHPKYRLQLMWKDRAA